MHCKISFEYDREMAAFYEKKLLSNCVKQYAFMKKKEHFTYNSLYNL